MRKKLQNRAGEIMMNDENGSWFNYDDVKGHKLLNLGDLKAALQNEGFSIADAEFAVAVFVGNDKNELVYAVKTGYGYVYFKNRIFTPSMNKEERDKLESELDILIGNAPVLHIIIEVYDDVSARRFNIGSFESFALARGDWHYQRFRNIADAVEYYDGAVPEDLTAALIKGPAVRITCFGYEKTVPASKFDAEAEAKTYLMHEVMRLLVIHSTMDAAKISIDYKGPAQNKVYDLTREIAEDYMRSRYNMGKEEIIPGSGF